MSTPERTNTGMDEALGGFLTNSESTSSGKLDAGDVDQGLG